MIDNISVTILTKNSCKYIEECLTALNDFPEIIILDNGSTDNTLEIAKNFNNVKIYKNEFIGFGPLKILATEYASNDWILSIDSDEILTKESVNNIKKLKKDNNIVYSFKRLNHYNYKQIKTCGWYPDKVKRLFNKKYTNFNKNMVHESIISNKVKSINSDIKHYTYNNITQLLEKMNKYTTLYAEEHAGKKQVSIFKAIASAKWAFIKSYIINRGFIDGMAGFSISLCNALGAFFKHYKLIELNKLSNKK